MRIWLTQMGENIQTDGESVRLFRMGLLAEYLESSGHQVVRWAPTFNHYEKRQRFDEDTVVTLSPHHEIRHLYTNGYHRHRSLARVRCHRTFARRWLESADDAARPDVILVGMPTPENLNAANQLGERYGVPVAADVRDLWPDAFYAGQSDAMKAMLKVALAPMRRQVSLGLQRADAIIAISEDYLSWALDKAHRDATASDAVFPLSYSPPPVVPSLVASAEAKWHDLLLGRPVTIVFFGSFSASFDLQTVVAAAQMLEDEHPGIVEFVLCGDGPSLEAIRRSSAGLDFVHLPGWVSATDIAQLMQVADMAIAPYRSDATMGLPNKLSEYWSAALPVVSSLRGEAQSLVSAVGGGLFYESSSPDSLKDALSAYVSSPELRRTHGANGRDHWARVTSPDVVYPSMVDHLEALVRPAST